MNTPDKVKADRCFQIVPTDHKESWPISENKLQARAIVDPCREQDYPILAEKMITNQSTIRAVEIWIACYGIPNIRKTEQAPHFSGNAVQERAEA